MPDFLRVADGIVAKDRIGESEAAQYDALKKAVLTEKAKKEQEQRETRISQGLPPDLTAEERKEVKKQEDERRADAKRRRKEALGRSRSTEQEGGGRRFLGCLCFGAR